MCVFAHLFNVTSVDSVYQAHPWFKGIEWDKLYQMEAAFIPEVKGELDTQNFEMFEEVSNDGYQLPYNVVIQSVFVMFVGLKPINYNFCFLVILVATAYVVCFSILVKKP